VSYLFDFGLLLGVNGIYVGSRPFISDFSNTYDHQESYTVINAKIEYSWNWFIFFLNLNNIFDETYSSYGVLGGFPTQRAYYPSPEFNIFAGVTMRIGNW
jgi:outer membrane receptor protein involved in Fe transport